MPDAPLRKAFTILATSASISGVGLGLLLTPWHPRLGVALIISGALYLLWEVFTCEFLAKRVPEGMLRFLGAFMLACFLLLILGPDVQKTMSRQQSKPLTLAELKDALSAAIPRETAPFAPPVNHAQAKKGKGSPAPSPIQVSLDCFNGSMPITVPAGITVSVYSRNRHTLRPIGRELRATSGPLIWPDVGHFDPAEHENDAGAEYFRCDVTNHGNENLLGLTISFPVSWVNETKPIDVTINPLDQGSSRSFYIVNNCPTEMIIDIPHLAKARTVSEVSARDFELELRSPVIFARHQMRPSTVNWMQSTCE